MLTTKLARPITRPVVRGVTGPWRGGSSLSAQVAAIFAKYNALGVPTIWYDLSDKATLWVDNLGAAQVTASGQTIGLLADKSKGMVLGPELFAPLDLTTWGNVGNVTPASKTSNSFATTGSGGVNNSSLTIGKTYEITYSGVAPGGAALALYNALSTPANLIAMLSGQAQTLKFTAITASLYLRLSAADSATVSLSVRELPGYHASQATTTSRPLYTEAAGLAYALFDGGDDSWQTVGNVDLSGTDKVAVVAGVRKLSDATRGIVFEIGNNTPNGLLFDAPTDATTKLRVISAQSGGNPTSFTNMAQFNAPVSAVVSALCDWGAPTSTALIGRANGAAMGTNFIAPTAGNFPNTAVYIGRRGGASLPFNGQLGQFMLIGTTILPAELAVLEAFATSKMGITL